MKDKVPNIAETDLWRYSYKTFPEITINFIEFLVVEHINKKSTVISLNEGGFQINKLTKDSLENIISSSYAKVNIGKRNIVFATQIRIRFNKNINSTVNYIYIL